MVHQDQSECATRVVLTAVRQVPHYPLSYERLRRRSSPNRRRSRWQPRLRFYIDRFLSSLRIARALSDQSGQSASYQRMVRRIRPKSRMDVSSACISLPFFTSPVSTVAGISVIVFRSYPGPSYTSRHDRHREPDTIVLIPFLLDTVRTSSEPERVRPSFHE